MECFRAFCRPSWISISPTLPPGCKDTAWLQGHRLTASITLRSHEISESVEQFSLHILPLLLAARHWWRDTPTTSSGHPWPQHWIGDLSLEFESFGSTSSISWLLLPCNECGMHFTLLPHATLLLEDAASRQDVARLKAVTSPESGAWLIIQMPSPFRLLDSRWMIMRWGSQLVYV